MKKDYTTLSEAMNDLRKEGYTEDFNLRNDHIDCSDGRYKMKHDEFKIDSFYRFEGETDPSDESILYAISSEKYHLKGVLVNGYGISSDAATDELIRKLDVRNKK